MMNSKRDQEINHASQSQIFFFADDMDITYEEYDSDEEDWRKSPTPRLDLSDNRYSGSINDESQASSDYNNMSTRQAHQSEKGFKTENL